MPDPAAHIAAPERHIEELRRGVDEVVAGVQPMLDRLDKAASCGVGANRAARDYRLVRGKWLRS
jgi:hypothetical protein